jgi:prepilin-type N-terminal cleavage/methylation domain-containing protein
MGRFQRVAAARREEAGFTLAEVLIAIAILGIIGGALAVAFASTARNSVGVANRFATSHDAQIASAFLATDVQSNNAIDTPSCSGGSAVVGFRYRDNSLASYCYSAGQIRRNYAGTPSASTILVRNARAAPTVTCSNPTGCAIGSQPAKVTISVPETDDFTYSLVGARRSTVSGATPNSAAYPPLLALGSYGIVLNGGHAPLHVGGNVIVNSTSKPAITGNSGDFTVMPGSQVQAVAPGTCAPCGSNAPFAPRANPVPDPLAGLSPPSPGPGVFVFNTPYVPSGVIPPGIYILNAGLNMSGGTATGSGVLFYVAGGTFSMSGNASLTLTNPLSQYSSVSIWQPSSNHNELTISGRGSGSSFAGVIYAPGATVAIAGNGNVRLSSIIAAGVRVDGGGSGGNVCLNLTPQQCAAFG